MKPLTTAVILMLLLPAPMGYAQGKTLMFETAYSLGEKCRSRALHDQVACFGYIQGAADLVTSISGEMYSQDSSSRLCLENITIGVIKDRLLKALDENSVEAQKRTPACFMVAATLKIEFHCLVNEAIIPPQPKRP